MKNGIIFYGLNKDSDDFLHRLDERITDRIESVKKFAESPIEYSEKYEAWFIDKEYLGFGQDGGYPTKEMALVALTIIKLKPEVNYQTALFIAKGLDLKVE